MDHHHFSFAPFGVLYCLTLFGFLAAFVASRVMHRRENRQRPPGDVEAVLKFRFASGAISEEEYMRLRKLLNQ